MRDPEGERHRSSTWQSLERKAGTTEVDYLNGEVVLLGRLHGVPTPVNTVLPAETPWESHADRSIAAEASA